jgi:hypothetical protein
VLTKLFNEEVRRITVVAMKNAGTCECGADTRYAEMDLKNQRKDPICLECIVRKLNGR